MPQRSIRMLTYALIAGVFKWYMDGYGGNPIRIRKFEIIHIFNAVNHVLNNTELAKIGLTSWLSIHALSEGKAYTLPAYLYYHYAATKHLLGDGAYTVLVNNFSFALVALTCVATAEASLIFIPNNLRLGNYLTAVSVFAISITSPFNYRMMLVNCKETYFIFFTILGHISLKQKRKPLGYIWLSLGGLMCYYWCFFLSFYFFLKKFMLSRSRLARALATKDIQEDSKFQPLTTKGHATKEGQGIYNLFNMTAIYILPLGVTFIQSLILRLILPGLLQENTSAVFRAGLGGENIHHGGFLGAIQFLGGIRITTCISTFTNSTITLNGKIAAYNCLLATIGMAVISVISVAGFLVLTKKSYEARKYLLPLFLAYVAFICIMQQTLAAHVHIYSVVFAYFYSLGLIVAIYCISARAMASKIDQHFTAIAIVCGIVLNSLRIDSLVGLNG